MPHVGKDLGASGFLLVNKPRGPTSFDVVAHVRRVLGVHKVGHAGTLDPFATGLLIIGVGIATKRLGTYSRLPKTYGGEITLGATSTTDDIEGEIQERAGTGGAGRGIPSSAEVARVLREFVGERMQRPPTYSAIKVRGVPAYRRARRLESFTLPLRHVRIEEIQLLRYAYPLLAIRCIVNAGTYIRALARDIGEHLQTGGYLSALERTKIGPYRIDDAVALGDVTLKALHRQLGDEGIPPKVVSSGSVC